jgi:isocitrate dehydrogenase kinase/phosphatase
VTGSSDPISAAVHGAFIRYRSGFDGITRRAGQRFADRDWQALQEASATRLDLYNEEVDAVVAELSATEGAARRSAWITARRNYAARVAAAPDVEIAETFFSSVTRRILKTEGTDPAVEFTDEPSRDPGPALELREYAGADLADLLLRALRDADIGGPRWQNLDRDVRLAAKEVAQRLTRYAVADRPDRVAMCPYVLYRGRAAYLIGAIGAGATTLPLAFAIHNTSRGLVVGAVLLEPDDISVLFSYTRSSFLVDAPRPAALVAYIQSLIPHRKTGELYTAIGFHKHGKTERYRDLRRFIESSGEHFDFARGIRGMVMIVFTLPGYDTVFKIIRDRFPYPKQTTRGQVMAKYRLVFRHDRAGRLIDAREFEHLKFSQDRFTAELLSELATQARRSVAIDGDTVTLHHVYVERKVVPLDIYVRESNPVKARAAIIDYGRAIKNLAMSDIFPGDMLLKNFGVTRSGRVVFYDYDELTRVTDCNFRELPETSDPDREMAADPWFGVGDNDVFPEEFRNFLGLRRDLREVLEQHHGDLFGVRFWQRVQERIRAGEVIEIFPYQRSRRLGAGVRRRARTTLPSPGR